MFCLSIDFVFCRLDMAGLALKEGTVQTEPEAAIFHKVSATRMTSREI